MPYPRYSAGGGGGGSGSRGGGGGYGYSSTGSGGGGGGGGRSGYSTNVSPWQGGGPAQTKVDPLTLLMGAMIGGGGASNQGGAFQQLAGLAMANAMQGQDDSRGARGYDRRDRQRYRDRSSPRRNYRSRSRSKDRRYGGSSQRRSSGISKRNRSPEKRAEHEIYIGNYPVKFKETDVRKLFEDHGVKVGAIRLKHDGLKVFAFAETDSVEEIDKAKGSMEGVEIQGRKLRVRSSKDTDKKKREEKKEEKKEEQIEKEDVKKHLVTAFLSFLDREFASDSAEEQFKGLIDAARTSLSTAYDLPNDDSYAVPKDLEEIFYKDAKHHVKKPAPVIKMDVKEEKEETEIDENYEYDDDDDGNWKRRHRSKDDEEEKSSEVLEGVSGSNAENSEDNIQEHVEDDLNPEVDHDLLVNV